jgi:two-component system capsular synthesis response regulator RcsB
MFKNVLIVEDHESANLSIQQTLEQLGVGSIKYVFYCDHAFNWIKKALQEKKPYDLLITDLHFEDDGTPQSIKSGYELIQSAKAIQPQLKVIVFSSEGRTTKINPLFQYHQVNGYVRKARRDSFYLKQAIETVSAGKIYRSPDIEQLLRKENLYEFSAIDIAIIDLLAQGVLQRDIPEHLKAMQIKPSSLSSVEKKLAHMKEMLDFNKNEQLIAYCKDLGII